MIFYHVGTQLMCDFVPFFFFIVHFPAFNNESIFSFKMKPSQLPTERLWIT